MRRVILFAGFVAVAALGLNVGHAAHKWGLKEGTPELKSAGQLAFGPDGVLFVGDHKAATVYAIDTLDPKSTKPASDRAVPHLDRELSRLFEGAKMVVNDLAVNPDSGNIYLSVSDESGANPALVRVDGAGKLSRVALANLPMAKVELPNPPEDKVVGEGRRARNRRNETITDMAYVNGKLFVAGVTADSAPSRVREINFPFADADTGTNVEIYHAAHARVEDNATIRTFIPFTIDGVPSILAGFTCTPLVRFSIDSFEAGAKVRGTTVAELGNMNTPIDMIAYEKGGETFLLLTNTARGVMKISTRDIGRKEGLTQPVPGGGTAGQTFEKIESLKGAVQLDRLTNDKAVVIMPRDEGLALLTVELP